MDSSTDPELQHLTAPQNNVQISLKNLQSKAAESILPTGADVYKVVKYLDLSFNMEIVLVSIINISPNSTNSIPFYFGFLCLNWLFSYSDCCCSSPFLNRWASFSYTCFTRREESSGSLSIKIYRSHTTLSRKSANSEINKCNSRSSEIKPHNK